jgi:hypothetical protein
MLAAALSEANLGLCASCGEDGPQMRPNLRKVDEPVDLAQQMVVGDMPLEAEAVNSA